MKTNFNGKEPANFKRHSSIDAGYYSAYQKKSDRIPPVAYLVVACLVAWGVFCLRVLSVWGY